MNRREFVRVSAIAAAAVAAAKNLPQDDDRPFTALYMNKPKTIVSVDPARGDDYTVVTVSEIRGTTVTVRGIHRDLARMLSGSIVFDAGRMPPLKVGDELHITGFF